MKCLSCLYFLVLPPVCYAFLSTLLLYKFSDIHLIGISRVGLGCGNLLAEDFFASSSAFHCFQIALWRKTKILLNLLCQPRLDFEALESFKFGLTISNNVDLPVLISSLAVFMTVL